MNPELAFTFREMELLLGSSTPSRIMLAIPYADTAVKKTHLIERAIDWVVSEFAKSRQNRLKRSEDELTEDVIFALRTMTIPATHDTQYGGHCDIVVEMRDDYLWLGEAKIHTGYDWLLKGYNQLRTRYSTGLPGQDVGGMVIYCRNQDAGAVMDQWMEHLAANCEDVVVQQTAAKALTRHSEHVHPGTGTPYLVRHTIIPLYFQPQDS